MATNGARIIIPTSVRLQVENQAKVMRDIQDNLKNIFSDVDPSSSLGKGLLRLYDQIEVRQNKINNLLGKEFFSEKDYAKIASYMEQIQDAFLEIQRRTNRATPAQLGLNTEEIEKAAKALEDFKRHIVSIKNVSAAQALEESNDALKQFISLSEKIGFDPGKNLQTNLGNMNRTLDSASGRLAELKVEADEATESLEATKQKLFSLKVDSNIANGELNKRAIGNTNLATQFASVKTGTGGKRTKTNILEDYNKILESWIDTTTQKFSAEGEMFSDIFSNWLSIDKASLGNTAAEIVEGLKIALREQLVSGNSLNFAPVKEWTSRILAGNIGEMDQQYVHLASKAEEVAQNLSATQTEFDTASEHASNIQQQIQQAQELIEIINQKIKELTELKQNFEKKIDEDNTKELQQKKDDLTKANRRATAGAYQGAAENIKLGGTTTHDVVADYEARVEGRKLAEEAEREAENFKNNLKQSISHWLSAQMIITKIREGVYQAWQDIQGLDKAMTNIAVVTDMSVSDLWGKIDEYMAIAQEYGVTTQGVYEVSQLYYQQGLSTSEVMEATTETLKMARIAGMDYAEAADAMTVAIRAFKMEMSDAQVITDVYSKVAAVTASDSQELAIAMSKTASSAESVGSSFENTTAMLAVMIETTRESAQNLGSALKSIISRYGEMKTGLTVDSEGEAIDYNKVDTALQSVGISIKDAQGQFRNFDDVIFELSKKWDSLDKNTQRYIATIMAGNRQQSRFIALVDNWERLDEVSAAAYDSEDAGLLQYAKTLDSLETKLNALSTSFQQFYMNIINGDTFKGAIDLITKILNSFNKLGSLNTIFSAVTIVKGLKLTLTLVSNLLSSSFTKIYQNYKSIQEKMTLTAFAEAKKRADGQAKIETEGAEMAPTFNRRWKKSLYNKTNSTVAIGADIANLVGATFAGLGIAQAANGKDYGGNNTGAVRGAFSTTIGNTLSNAASGATIGSAIGSAIAPGVGTAIGAAAGAAITGIGTLIAETLTSIIPTIEKVEQERYERYKAETEEKNIERAETKEEYNNLKTLIDKYENSEENKYNSDEDYSAWLDANNALIEAYPELIGYIDAEGNAIADMTKATDILTSKMNAASEATNAYYKAKIAELEQEYKAVSSKVYNTGVIDAVLNDFLTKGSRFTTGTAHLVDKNNRGNLFTGYSATAEDIDAWLKSVGVEDIYDALWQISGIADKGIDKNITDTLLHFGVISKNEKGIYSLDSDYAKFLSRNSILQEQQTVLDTQAQSHINLLSKNTDLDDDIVNIAGYTDLIVSYAQKFHNYTQQQIAELSAQDYDRLINEFINFYNGLSTDNQNVLKTLYENLDKYSAQDLDDLLLTNFNLQQDDAIYQLFLQKWFDANYKTKYDYAKLIWQDDFEFDDYTAWLTKQEDPSNTEENRQKYAEEVSAKIRGMSGNLVHFIDTAADSTLEAYAGYLTKERSVIKNGGNAGAIAQKRLDYINQLIGTGLLDLVDKDLLPQFISLLFSDNAGTTDWAINLSKFISDNNVFADGGGLDLTPFLYENVNTQLENLKTEQGQVIDSIKNLFEKQSEGFTIQEAENLIAKHGLDGDINDYFIVENGQLILKNYTDFVGLIVDKFNTTSQTLKDDITQAQQIIEDGWLNNAPIDSKIIGWAQDIASGKDIKDTIAQGLLDSGFDAALADEIAAEFQAGNIKTTSELKQYLYDRYQNVALIDQLLGEQLKEYQNDAETVSKFIRSYKFGVIDTNITLRKIISNGFKDVHEAELTALSEALQKPIDEVIRILDLEYNAGNESWQGKNFAYLVEERNKLAQITNMGNTGTAEQNARFNELNSIIHSLTTGSGLDFDEVLISSTQVLRDTQEVLEDSFSDGILSYSELESVTNGQQDAFIKAYEGVLFDYNESVRGYVLKQGAQIPSAEDLQKYGFSINSEDWGRWPSLALKSWKESLNNYIEQGGKNLTIEDQGTAKLALQGLGIKESDLGQYLNGDSLNIQALANFGYEAAVIYVSNLTDSINDDFNSYFENLTKVNFEDLAQLYKNITGKEEIDPALVKEYHGAIDEAKKGNTKLLSNILLQMVEEAQQRGYDIDITTLQNTIQDAALSLMATIAKTFEAGIEGTMTNTNYTQLLKDIGINQFEADGSLSKDWEHWQNLVISTNEGLKFTKDGLTEVYNTVRAHNAMASQGILEMIADDLTQYKTLGSTLEYIQELRTKIQNTDKRDEDKIKQYEDELALAEKILRVRSQDPDQFNFMSRDIPDEIQSPLNVWQNAADAASTLQDAKTNGYMGAEDFYRIVTTASEYMTAAGQEFKVAGMTYEDLISAATSSLATANGNLVVDFSKFGVDFAGGIDDMAGGLEDGLKALAEEQIKMLDAMIAMLETIKELDELGDKIGNGDDIFEFDELFNFDAFGNLTGINEQVQQWFTELQGIIGIIQVEGKSLSEAWSQGIITPEELMAFMNDFEKISYDQFATIEELIAHVQSLAQTHFGGSVEVKAVKDLQNVFEINSDGTVIFDGVTYTTETEALKAYAAQDAALMGGDKPYEITSANGTKVQYKRDAELDIVYQVHTTEDGAQTYWYQGKEIKGTEAFQEALTTNDQEKLNEVLKESGIKSTEEISPVTTAKYGGINLEIGEKLFINGKEVESLDAWARETFEGVSKEEAEAIESQIKKEPYTIGSYSGVNYQFEENASVFVNGEIVTSLADYVKSTFEKVAENAEVQAGTTAESYYPGGSYSGLSYTFGDGVTVNGLVYASLAQYVQGLLATTMESLESVAKIPTTVTVEANTDDAETDLQNVITKLQTIEKAKSRSVSVTASTSTAYNQLQAIISALKNINSKSITVTTTYTQVGNPPSNNNPDVDVVSGAGATGNVALAKGRGTFMGELGPELYVQNGHYYIAGKNGPEFVDLQDDAIVFNHLQTRRIMSTGHAFGRGTPVVSERRSVALATGNAFGPAHANSSIDSAIEQLKTAREFWKGLLNQLSLSELMSGSGGHKGGGSGNSIKAVTEELQEWYNLSRQIADIEQDINNLLAERENIEWSNGEEYLKSLREQQKLLQQQMATQQALLDYQELQLKRQADHINQNRIWSQFLTVGEDGLLQYIEGNETNGGKGALQVLQELNQMSGEEQTAYLKRIGYSYTNNDGKKLEGQELVEQFFQELQDQINQYDSLYDTVHGTQETLEELQTSINDINNQIKENQMELEEEIFDIIVESLEKEIEVLEEQVDLIEEANEAYIDGLNEALSAERQMYDDNQKIADREQLQRQLSLLRRSGGSASEIASLEEQLNDMLKDEYFNNQERMIEDIRKANDLQVQQLQTQIKLQEDSLQYQKEHGVIWNQVYQVLAQSKDEILAFMQGKKPEFFSQSLLRQEEMLTNWAHKIGIYSEDRKYQNFAEHARNNLWDNGQAWNLGDMNKYQSTYNTLTDEEKNTIRDQFTSVYAQARLDGKDHTTAANEAAAAVSQTLKRKQDANNSQNNQAPTTNPNPQNPGGGDSGGSSGSSSGGSSGGSSSGSSGSTYNSVKITVTAGDGHGNPLPQTATVSPKQTFTIQTNPDGGYDFDYITYNGTKKYSNSITPTGQVSSIAIKVYYKQSSSSTTTNNSSSSSSNNGSSSSSSKQGWHYQLNGPNGEREPDKTVYSTREKAQAAGAEAVRKKGSGWKYSTKYYSQGGIVDYTGIAMVHGSKTKPESFLNAEQTAQIREGLKESGKGGALEGIKAALLKLDSSIKAVTNINNKSESNSYTIAPGAVVIQVEQLNDAYDVDTLSADIMNRMYAIGNKSTNRGVSRR